MGAPTGIEDRDIVAGLRSLAGDDHATGEELLGTLAFPAAERDAVWSRVVELADPRLWWLPPLEGRGNLGWPRDGDPPADPPHVDVRVSLAGHAALADPHHPLHLANGDLHDDGTRPSFHPVRVAAALRALVEDRGADLGGVLGRPAFPAGCDVVVDVDALLTGQPTPLTLSAVTVATLDHGRWPALRISRLPPRTTTDAFVDSLFTHIRARTGEIACYEDRTSAATESDHASCWRLAPGADHERAREFVLSLPGLRVHTVAELQRPAATTLGSWLDRHPTDHARAVVDDLEHALRPTGEEAAHQVWDRLDEEG